MKKFVTILAGAALLTSAFASGSNAKAPGPIVKPWELTFGYHMPTGDLDTIGFSGGFMAGLDYYIHQFGANTMGFVGVRGWFLEESGVRSTAYGAHYGVRFNAGNPGGAGAGSGMFFFKIAAGYYNNDLDGVVNEWGFGGFATLGYEFANGFNIEFGYQFAPDVASINNVGWYIAGSFRF